MTDVPGIDPLPEYSMPPVTEVALGVLFEPVPGLLLPHIGAFWAEVKADFPRAEEAAPMLPLVEVFGPEPATIDLGLSDLPLPRTWLVDQEGKSLLQLQRNRFHYNWRKQEESDRYPRYAAVSGRFHELFQRYVSFLENEGHLSPPRSNTNSPISTR